MYQTIKVLSIDGGGIRGIIPATILSEIEKQTETPISKLFDLIAGTSAGGIIALGLTKPGEAGNPHYNAKELVRLFEHHGGEIFNRSTIHTIASLGSLVDEKYPKAPLENLLNKYFGKSMLSQSLTPIIITAYEIERRIAFFFKTKHAKGRIGYDFRMRDVARATSAAPTYFEPAKINVPDIADYFSLIDGGVYANNPAMCAYVEARAMFPEAQDFIVVSLGTGELTKPIPYNQAKDWGIAKWARPILNVVFDGINDTVDYQLETLLNNGVKRYFRFQPRLDEGSEAFDNIDLQNIRNLKLIAEDVIRSQKDELKLLVKMLMEEQ